MTNTGVEPSEVDSYVPEKVTLVQRSGVGDYFLVMGLDALCNDAGPGLGNVMGKRCGSGVAQGRKEKMGVRI